MLRGAKIASAQGNTGTTMIALAALLREGGLDISDVEIVTMPTTDQVAALENGSVTAGIIVEPLNLPLVERNAAVRVWPTTMDDYPISTLAFGPTLLRDNPDVGKAFIAALRDTYINHLQGDYLHDPAKAKSIAEEIEQPLPSLQQVRSDIYGPTLTLPADLIARHEETWRQWPKLLTYEEPLVQSDVVDMRFVDWANAKDD
jgi:ABC-type nitrate/sulfonate/bicarbonate transport system substrate-binding protein